MHITKTITKHTLRVRNIIMRCNTYHKNRKKREHNRHQHNTDDGGQTMKRWGMYRWACEATIQVKEASSS